MLHSVPPPSDPNSHPIAGSIPFPLSAGETAALVDVYEVRFPCTSCNRGEMRADGYSKEAGQPPNTLHTEYRHHCSFCKRGTFLLRSYPFPVYVDRPQPQPPMLEEHRDFSE